MKPVRTSPSKLRIRGGDAVSPVVATIMMVAVTVILSSVLFVLVLEIANMTDDGGQVPDSGSTPLPTGSGTPEDPYLLRSIGEIIDLVNDRDSHYALASDIDASSTRFLNDGAGFEPMFGLGNSFRGSFDGNHHNITGLYINRPSSNQVGFFSWIAADADVRNINIIDAEVIGGNNVGILAGRSTGTILECSTSGTVTGQDRVGGLVGANWRIVERSHSNADVTASGSIIGGLVGENRQNQLILDSYATGTVTGGSTVGGLVGLNSNNARITNCYSVGVVSGTADVGGLIGSNAVNGQILSSYWDTQTSNTLVSSGGTGKTTSQMKQSATFLGWDFTDIWVLYPGQYPLLVSS